MKFHKKYKDVYEGIVPLYGIYIYYSPNPKSLRKMYNLVDKDNEPDGFCCWMDGGSTVGIYLPVTDDYRVNVGTLSHEAFHAAMKVGDLVGLRPTMEDNESIAYIISWIVDWILDCVNDLEKRNLHNNKG